jgi:5'-phosphate synthase pdxT subunit
LSEVTVGVLGLQGDIEEHVAAAEKARSKLEVEGEAILVKSTEDVKRIGALIIPGGESTVMGVLTSIKGLIPALREKISGGMPTLGTCAGMIMLSKKAEDRAVGETNQPLMGALDIAVERNAFGRQRESFEADIDLNLPNASNFHAVFIRAPAVKSIGRGVKELGRLDDAIVAVQQGNVIGTSFHPELSGNALFHEHLIRLATESRKG